ncbi:MAG: DNA phosphorothioation-associated protein 4 [Candidatus Heimdallarchaeota archaeon]
MARRVRRPKDKTDLLNQLTSDDQGGPFETYKDVLIFAATLGYYHERHVEFEQTDEPIAWDIFKSNDRALINMIALSDKQNLTILSEAQSEDKIKCFEEYANGGLEIIQREIVSGTVPPLESFIDLFLKVKKPSEEILPELSKLSKLLGGET